MSKNEALSTIENTDLTTVCGGLEVTGKGKVEIGPGSGSVEGEVTYKRTPYESCLAGVMSRKDWTPEQVKNTCGLPPS
jgi:hypothetical protein